MRSRPSLLQFLALALLALLLAWPAGEALARDSAAKQVARADVVAKEVAKLRGLRLKKKIDSGVMSKAQIRKRIIKLLHQEYTQAELDAESLAMKRFGLIDEGSDYVEMMLKLLQDQIAGFYDQHEKKLYIAGWTQIGGDMLMAHEIDHALQDQHFDLLKFMTPDKKNADSMLARQALVEGDGMALMLEFQMASMKQAPPWGNPVVLNMLKKGMTQGMGAMKNAPLVMREGLTFPYLGGLEFIVHFRKHLPWTAIDDIYKKPPLSSEQILHPKKYESYEKPDVVTAALPAALRGYVQKISTVHGEKGLEIFLRSHGVKQGRAVIAAAGWGGDRMAVYAKRGHKGSTLAGSVGVSLSSWDEEADAMQFFEALEHALPRLSGGSRTKRSDGVLQFAIGASGQLVAERKGDQVLLIIGAPAKSAENLRAGLWKSWTVKKN